MILTLPVTINRDEALEIGMTHEGTLYGIPVWAANVEQEIEDVVAKFYPLTLVVMMFDGVVGMLNALLYLFGSDDQLCPTVQVKGRIK